MLGSTSDSNPCNLDTIIAFIVVPHQIAAIAPLAVSTAAHAAQFAFATFSEIPFCVFFTPLFAPVLGFTPPTIDIPLSMCAHTERSYDKCKILAERKPFLFPAAQYLQGAATSWGPLYSHYLDRRGYRRRTLLSSKSTLKWWRCWCDSRHCERTGNGGTMRSTASFVVPGSYTPAMYKYPPKKFSFSCRIGSLRREALAA